MAEDAHLLRLNAFNRPVIYKDAHAAYVQIVYLILLEPGKFQSHPNMGVGLRSKWRFQSNDNIIYDLKEEITRQIAMFLPKLQDVRIEVMINEEHIVTIIIDTVNGTYAMQYNQSTDEFKILDNSTLSLSDISI